MAIDRAKSEIEHAKACLDIARIWRERAQQHISRAKQETMQRDNRPELKVIK